MRHSPPEGGSAGAGFVVLVLRKKENEPEEIRRRSQTGAECHRSRDFCHEITATPDRTHRICYRITLAPCGTQKFCHETRGFCFGILLTRLERTEFLHRSLGICNEIW